MTEIERHETNNPIASMQEGPTGGIYSLPVVGRPAREVRRFYDDMEPTEDDSIGVALGKNTIRYGTVAAAGAVGVGVGAIVCL